MADPHVVVHSKLTVTNIYLYIKYYYKLRAFVPRPPIGWTGPLLDFQQVLSNGACVHKVADIACEALGLVHSTGKRR